MIKVVLHSVVLLWLLGMQTACVSQRNLNEGIADFRAQHFRDAFIHLKPEAQRGNPDAQYAVGYMYYYGHGVVEDKKQAFFWINQAAKAGQREALAAVKLLNRQRRIDSQKFS